MSRASYARARRNGNASPESKLRPVIEKMKAKVVNTGNLKKDFADPDFKSYGKGKMPVVNRGAMVAGKGLQTYLKGTNALADKLRPALKKLPVPKGRPRSRVQKKA